MHSALALLPLLALILVGAKLAGLLSQRFGMPAVFGELLLGLLLGPSLLNLITPGETLHLIGQIGVIALMFMAGLETEVDEMRRVGRASFLTAAVLALAVVAKIVGCSAGALAGGFGRQDSLAIGVGMVARGEVALVMIAAGQAAGLVDAQLFSATIVMTLVTTLVTPPLLRLALRGGEHLDGTTTGNIVEVEQAVPSQRSALE